MRGGPVWERLHLLRLRDSESECGGDDAGDGTGCCSTQEDHGRKGFPGSPGSVVYTCPVRTRIR